jgi:hypothetical protein
MANPTSQGIDLGPWLDSIRSIPEHGDALAATFQLLADQAANGHAQAATNPGGDLAAPSRLDNFAVNTDTAGHAYFQITDNGNIQRGVNYFVAHSDNPAFTNAHVLHLGASRNGVPLYIGNSTRYFAAYHGYQGSDKMSPPVYHGGSNPAAVTGGGTSPATFPDSTGCGTAPTDGSRPFQGFGNTLYRQPSSGKKRAIAS